VAVCLGVAMDSVWFPYTALHCVVFNLNLNFSG